MSSQIFKESPPIKILFDFLDGVCEKQKNKYVFSKANFKKAQMEETIIPLFRSWKDSKSNTTFGDHIVNLGNQQVMKLLTSEIDP